MKSPTLLEQLDHPPLEVSAAEPTWLRELREEAHRELRESGLPSRRSEDFMYTDMEALLALRLEAPSPMPAGLDLHPLLDGLHGCSRGGQLVFCNGRIVPELCEALDLPPGARAESLAQALANTPDDVKPWLGKVASDPHALVGLNTVLFRDGVFIHVAAGVQVKDPIQIVFVAAPGDSPAAYHPRIVVAAEEGASVSVIESHTSISGPAFTNTVVELAARRGARVEYCRIQEDHAQSVQFGTLRVLSERESRVIAHAVSLGARASRNDVRATLMGPEAEIILNGLYVATQDQHVDNHLHVVHASPHCKSEQLYKGVLDDRATGSFTGRVVVLEDAQKTDAKQSNRHLLLSDAASANSRPQLEIYADDVKCSHGSTTGQLDENALFYLRSRGLPESEARTLLTRAFAAEVGSRLPLQEIRSHVEDAVTRKLCVGRRLKEAP